MFKSKKQPAPQKRLDSLIGAGTIVHGDILFTGGMRIDGCVEGTCPPLTDSPVRWS